MNTKFCGLCLATVLTACSAAVWGAEAAIPAGGPQSELPRWLEQLDGPEFAERQEASRKLSEAGREVFPELEKAAESGTREVATRAIDILKKHFERGDFDTKEAAQAALQRLAKSSNAAAAQRAQAALNPAPEAQPIVAWPFGGQQIRVANAQIQVQVGGNAGGNGVVNKRVHIRTVNGKQDIEVEEGNLKVKIQNFPGGNIEIEITDKINGKDVTKKVEAKDLDDLKKKDPAAAKVYEQYNQGGGNIRIGGMQIQGNVVPRPAAPVPAADDPFAPPRAAPAPAAPPAAGEARERMIKALDDHIARLKAQAQQNPAFQRLVESLEQQKKRLEDEANK